MIRMRGEVPQAPNLARFDMVTPNNRQDWKDHPEFGQLIQNIAEQRNENDIDAEENES